MKTMLERLGLKSTADLPATIDALRDAEREYNRSLGPLAENAHAAIDAAAIAWRNQLKRHVADGLPEAGNINNPTTARMASLAALLAAAGQPITFAELIDELVADGELDPTPRADVDAKTAEFRRKRTALKLAAEEEAVARTEADAAAARAEFDRMAAEVIGS